MRHGIPCSPVLHASHADRTQSKDLICSEDADFGFAAILIKDRRIKAKKIHIFSYLSNKAENPGNKNRTCVLISPGAVR